MTTGRNNQYHKSYPNSLSEFLKILTRHHCIGFTLGIIALCLGYFLHKLIIGHCFLIHFLGCKFLQILARKIQQILIFCNNPHTAIYPGI